MHRIMLDTYADRIRAGSDPVSTCAVDEDGTYRLVYVPFEHVNRKAKIAIVGITPGANQIRPAYAVARRLLQESRPAEDILREAIKAGAFEGVMRQNLTKVLKHFQIGTRLGLRDEADLWGRSADFLHSTSVVPHAAYKRGSGFAGSFEEVQRSRVLRECFEACFLPGLSELPRDCRFLALGPTPLAALDWCVTKGVIRQDQILGACPHPSPAGGSRIPFFVGETREEDLASNNPVRRSVAQYRSWHRQLSAAVEQWQPLPQAG